MKITRFYTQQGDIIINIEEDGKIWGFTKTPDDIEKEAIEAYEVAKGEV